MGPEVNITKPGVRISAPSLAGALSALFTMLLFSLAGCTQTTALDSSATRPHKLTWVDKNEKSHGEDIYFLWDGTELGKGEYGAWRAVAEISILPEGATVEFSLV